MEVQIRYAKPQDLPGLLALEQATFGTDCFERQLLVELLTQDRATVFVAEDPSRLLGVVYLLWKNGPHGPYGRIFSLAVHPQAQGHGVGARLMACAEEEAGARGANRLVLEVREENPPAIGFYRQLGYRQTQRVPHFYPDGVTALKFKKTIPWAPPARSADLESPQGLASLLPTPSLSVPSPLELATQALALGLAVRLLCPHHTRPPGVSARSRQAEKAARERAFAQGLGWGGYGFTGADLEVGWVRYAQTWLFFSPPGEGSPSWWRLLEWRESGLVLGPLGQTNSRPLRLQADLVRGLFAPKNRAYRALLLIGPSGPISSTGLR